MKVGRVFETRGLRQGKKERENDYVGEGERKEERGVSLNHQQLQHDFD